MKTIIFILGLVLVACTDKKIQEKAPAKKADSVSTRRIVFETVNDYNKMTINVAWFIWVDGDILESSHDPIFEEIKINDFKKYQEEKRAYANRRIPYLVKIKHQFDSIKTHTK